MKDTYECQQDSDCYCSAGFYGNGKVCIPCKKCSADATSSITLIGNAINCPALGATSDQTTCTCNYGFYGDGVTCKSCTKCSANAITIGSCDKGSQTDQVTCKCNTGYYGGTNCASCPAGTYSGYVGKHQAIQIIIKFKRSDPSNFIFV